jgi:truncated hemoglobin YjbI
MKPVLVTTAHRGVFGGLIPDDQDLTAKAMPLFNARMAISWGTTNGLMQLAETGPTTTSKISAPADIPMLHDITAIFTITEEAWKKWLTA